MTWTTYRNRGEILHAVIAAADERRDGLLPFDVDGVSEEFESEMVLLGALQMRWHTRLAGRIEEELMDQPMDLEAAVVHAWRRATTELPGVRGVLDHYRVEPSDLDMSDAMEKAARKERIWLAVMAGKANVHDTVDAAAAVHVGELIENRARVLGPLTDSAAPRGGLLARLRSAIAAA